MWSVLKSWSGTWNSEESPSPTHSCFSCLHSCRVVCFWFFYLVELKSIFSFRSIHTLSLSSLQWWRKLKVKITTSLLPVSSWEGSKCVNIFKWIIFCLFRFTKKKKKIKILDSAQPLFFFQICCYWQLTKNLLCQVYPKLPLNVAPTPFMFYSLKEEDICYWKIISWLLFYIRMQHRN